VAAGLAAVVGVAVGGSGDGRGGGPHLAAPPAAPTSAVDPRSDRPPPSLTRRELRRPVARAELVGRSVEGRPIRLLRLGDPDERPRALVFGCIHGTECEGTDITHRLRSGRSSVPLWVVENLNPDGLRRGLRVNGRGVDLNRNFPSEWRQSGQPFDPEHSGSQPLSEPESRLAARLIHRLRPEVTVWFHQPQAVVRAFGGSVGVARRYARRAGVPFAVIRWPRGTAPNWQNQRLGMRSFVVELPAGALSAAAARRHARALLAL